MIGATMWEGNGYMDKSDRPIIRVQRTGLEMAIEIVCAAVFAMMVVGVAVVWADLPVQIPVHFGWSGAPDAWGSKSSLISGLLVAGLIYAGLTLMRSYPHKYNYPWAITMENAEVQYRLACMLVAWLKLETISMFALIAWMQIRTASGAMSGLLRGPLVVLLVLLFATLGVYVYLGRRAR